MTSEEKLERGAHAEALLANPFFKQVLNELDGEYHARWRKAATVESREDLFRYVKVLEHIQDDLKTIAHTGKLERRRLEELESGKKRAPWLTI